MLKHKTHRELLTLPCGAMVIDTPGMRGLGMWDSAEELEKAFSDIELLAVSCRFKNCTHTTIMTLGPIGIHPDYKRQGYGKTLLDYSMEKAVAMGAGALCFEGNIDFYGKSGFVVASTMDIHYYDEPRDAVVPYFLCRELKKGYLDGISGTYHTPQGYFVDEDETEAFDKSFPVKEKLKLPGQL